jgi:hypothetical protein
MSARDRGPIGELVPAPRRRRRWRNADAVERTIEALRAGGRLEGADAATVALTRHLASALDQVDAVDFPAQVASLARAQLAALRLLRGTNDDDDGGPSDADALLAALLSPTVGDAEEPRA